MTDTHAPDILCIGSVLWDVIGRSASHMAKGADVPGRIIRLPGGVALNIAMTLVRFGLRPALTAERELYFYGNIDPGETVRVELLAARDDSAEFAHWWRVRRCADGARIADLITRKRRLA